jgi:5-methylcytosine-specific restriction endonuclease McrA
VSRLKYTAELLAPIVASSFSFTEVMRKLGLQPTGGNHRLITTRIRQAGLDTSHFRSKRGRSIVDAIPREQLEGIVPECRSAAAVLARLDLPVDGRIHRELSRRLRELEIDTTHFQGRGWAKGFTERTHPALAKLIAARRFPDDVVFVENGPALSGPSLVKRLLAAGWSYACAICAISDWCGKPLVLHLDHINGIHNDHRRENLRLLCPNCHSQTATYCNRAREDIACYTPALSRAWRNWYPLQS